MLLVSTPAWAQNNSGNARQGPSAQRVIHITDSGWDTFTATFDCERGGRDKGWATDQWELTLTKTGIATITATDMFCAGDYFEIYINGELVTTTPDPGAWGCTGYPSGPHSSGSFTAILCPGTYAIAVRDAGFDGHSPKEIQDERMCPAGFRVSGALSPYQQPLTARAAATEGLFAPALASPPEPSPEARQLIQYTDALAPFLSEDERGFHHLDVAAAQRAGVSADALAFGHQMVALNNRIVAAVERGEAHGLKPEDFAFIEPLYRYYADTGARPAQQSACGSFVNPDECARRLQSGLFFGSLEEVQDHLRSLGYRPTSFGARGGGPAGLDWTLQRDHPCGFGTYRNQANIRQDYQFCWTYTYQGPEPNPEIRTYIHPYPGWVGYVFWWHTRC
jgi:hypothetical protein